MFTYTLGKHRGKFVLTWYDNGTRHRRSLGTSDPAEAKRQLEQVKFTEAAFEKTRNKTIRELFSSYSENASPSRKERLKWAWKPLEAEFGDLYPHHITDARVRAWTSQRSLCVKSGTIRNELGSLRAALRWAHKKGLLESVPLFIQLPQSPPPKTHYFTRTQFAHVLEAATVPHVRLFLVLAITTGARSNALFDLTWDRVDFATRIIDLSNPEKTNTSKGRAIVPMNDTAYAVLLEAKKGALSNHVIEWAGTPIKRISKAFWILSKRTGLKITPHMLRHSAAVWMAESGIPMSEISQFLGHTNTSITERVYARYSPTYLRKAASALEL